MDVIQKILKKNVTKDKVSRNMSKTRHADEVYVLRNGELVRGKIMRYQPMNIKGKVGALPAYVVDIGKPRAVHVSVKDVRY